MGEALRLFTSAAGKGSKGAAARLGAMGQLMGLSAAETAKWSERAAELGSSKLQYALAIKYHEGDGVPAAPGKARAWLKRAAEGGVVVAQSELGMRLHEE